MHQNKRSAYDLSKLLVVCGLVLVMGACTPVDPGLTTPPGELAGSNKARITAPNVPAADARQLVEDNAAFAFDLYQLLAEEDGNVFFSPHSISIALAMTFVGARADTEQQMIDALHFDLPQARLHAAFNALDLDLAQRGRTDGVRLNVVNRLWGQLDFEFLDTFLDTLAEDYGASLSLLDFVAEPEPSRQLINDWVAQNTENRIKNLIPPGTITANTRLVLTNAIYFLADWAYAFDKGDTTDQPFDAPSGMVNTPTMRQQESFGYAAGADYQVVELPYKGEDLAMDIVLPDDGKFAEVEAALDAATFSGMISVLVQTALDLSMPKFTFTWESSLAPALGQLGMPIAFSPGADFSGMDGVPNNLFLQDVVHKAFVAVDEEGTEAAAATGVVVGVTSAPAEPVVLRIDRPFIFVIRDVVSGEILFVGHVVDPTAT